MRSTKYLVRTTLLAAIGLALAACAAEPAPYGYDDAYVGPPVYGTLDLDYGGGWDHGWGHGWDHGGHFAHAGAPHFGGFGGHGFGHAGGGFAHAGGFGHAGGGRA